MHDELAMAKVATALALVLAVLIGLVAGSGLLASLGQDQAIELRKSINELRLELQSVKLQLDQLASLQSQEVEKEPRLPSPAAIYEEVRGSVVSIKTGRKQLFLESQAQGSGFVVDSSGLIATNFHVVEGASKITVIFEDGSSYQASMVGKDPYSDLAILSIEPKGKELKPLVFGDTSKLKVGDPVIAIGNPFGLSGSLTTGVISQLKRSLKAVGGYTIPNVIQIDAAINPGNSGGPLLDQEGRLIGITTAIASLTGTFSGVGFAIPVSTLARELPDLVAKGSFDHPWLGLQGMDVTPEIAEAMGLKEASGWLITALVPNGPAHKAGLRASERSIVVEGKRVPIGGDVIVAIEGRKVRVGDDLGAYLSEFTKPGQTITLTIIREGRTQLVKVVLGIRPPIKA